MMRNLNFNTLLIASLLIAYFSFGWGRILPYFSLSAILVLVAFVISIAKKRDFSFHKVSIISVGIALILLFLMMLINDFNQPFSRVRDFSIIFIIFTVFYEFFKNENENNLNLIFKLIIIYLCLSSLVAVFQTFNFNFAWDLRTYLPATQDLTINNQIDNRLRPTGLSYYSVQLGYQLLFGFVMIDVASKNNSFIGKHLLKFYLAMVLGGIFGANLSLLFAIVVYLSVKYFLSNSRISYTSLFFITSVLILIIFSPVFERLLITDDSALSRLTFLYIGTEILMAFPFGVSYKEIYEIKLAALNNIDLGELPFSIDFLDTSFHNTFLTLGVETGWIGLIAYIIFYAYLLRFYFKNTAEENLNLRQIYLIGFSANLAYLVQLVTHNAGPFHSDPYFWMMNGILIGYCEFLKKESHGNHSI